MKIRINKYLSLCNIGPRRQISQLIKDGEFTVNSEPAQVGQMIDDQKDVVCFNGQVVKPLDEFVYIKLNKPKNVLSTVSDDEERGRTTVLDVVGSNKRLYPVGRLDFESTGLILLTNDGDLALKLTHPRYHLPKIYEVEVFETLTNFHIKQLTQGLVLDTATTLPSLVKKLDVNKFEITLYQGMKRQIREMCKVIGLSVKSLHRVAIGPLKLGNLKSGDHENLTREEVVMLKSS